APALAEHAREHRAQLAVARVGTEEVVDVAARRREAGDEGVDVPAVEGRREVLDDAHFERTLFRKRMRARLKPSACSVITAWPPGTRLRRARRMSLTSAREKSGGVRMSSLPPTTSVGTLIVPR